MESLDKKDNRATYLLILAFILLAAGIITVGYLSYRSYANQYRVEVERQLSAIADLKVGDLAHWRKERIGDAAVFYGNKAFSSLIHQYFNNPNDFKVQRQLWTWLSKVQLLYSYERLLLFDARGVLRMSVPDSNEPVASGISQRAAIVMRSEQINFQDFYRDEQNQQIYLTIMVPILSEEIGSQALGVLVLRIDPETYLYPFIRYWPTPSQTAETLLVRREGNEAVFLNDLRFQKDVALKLRVPLEKVELPAVKATLGQEGIVEGQDYREIPVIAAIRSVPDSPWFIIARMDIFEVYGPLKERLWLMTILVVALIIGIGTGIGLVWRQQHIRFYQEQHAGAAALRESEERYRALVENASDVVFRTDENGYFTFVNPVALRITGYEEEEIIGKHYKMFIRPDMFKEAITSFANQLINKIQNTYTEYPILTKEGNEVWIGQNTQLTMEEDHVTGFQAVARDITKMKQADEMIRQMAYHDSLTGLPNRKLFSDRLGIALAQAQRNQKIVGIAMLDLDNFKNVNDTLGHDVGDLLLKATAERLSAALRKGDTVARFGGDEFVLILPHLKVIEDAIQVAQKVLDSFRKPFFIDTHQLIVTASIGIAVYPDDGIDESVLLKNADIAMYQAKQSGRDRYQLCKKA